MMCSEGSPRVSFSQDSGQAEEGVPRRDTELLDMNSDFEFNITGSSDHESCCSADELFADGFILPVKFLNTPKQVRKCAAPPTLSLPPLPPPPHENSKKCLQIIEVHSKKVLEERPSESKSFWGFKRSSSLNCDLKKSLIRSLLSRSNSTGSQQSPLKENKHPRAQKLQASSTSSPSLTSSSSNHYQSRQSKKNCHGNGVKVSPVLNLPPPYISKGTANLFGFGSLLRSSSSSGGGGSKDKKNKK